MKRWVGCVLFAAVVLASSPVLLTLFLNPARMASEEAIALIVALFLPYFAIATLVIGVLSVITSGFIPRDDRRRSPVSEHRRPILPLFLAMVGSSLLYWWNLWQYRHSIPIETAHSLALTAAVISAATLVVLAVALDAFFFPTRSRGFGAPLLVLAAWMPLIAPLMLRPALKPPPTPLPLKTVPLQPLRRVSIVGMDGIGWSNVKEQVVRGNLPAFRTFIRHGACGPLATLRPTEGPPIWTTIVTGRFPRDHGVKSFVNYRLWGSEARYELLPRGALVGVLQRAGCVSVRPVPASARRVKALWNALNAFGIDVGVVRLWGTHPVEKVRGFMLSHYFHAIPKASLDEALFPMSLAAEVTAKKVRSADIDRSLLAEFLDMATLKTDQEDAVMLRDLAQEALSPDLTYLRAGEVLRAAYDPPFFLTYFFGLDVVGHSFLRYARPEQFGDVNPAEARRYGHVYDRYVAMLGQDIADRIEALHEGELLIVLSAYGMRPVSLWHRLMASVTGARKLAGTHMNAPDGFIAIIGDGVGSNVVLRNASVLDITPTILYLMGLPVARDMEGRVLTEALQPEFMREHPVSFIPSYESLNVTPMAEEGEFDLPLYADEEH